MRYVVVLALLLVLTGCGPSPDEMKAAWSRCTSEASLWVLQNPDATEREVFRKLGEVSEKCAEHRETIGDEKFVEVYG